MEIASTIISLCILIVIAFLIYAVFNKGINISITVNHNYPEPPKQPEPVQLNDDEVKEIKTIPDVAALINKALYGEELIPRG